MKPRSNSGSTTGNPSASAPPSSPSVPISVYRELAAELQATRAMLDSLNTKNQQLAQQNQQLRVEIGRVVQSALTLQPLVEYPQSADATEVVDRVERANLTSHKSEKPRKPEKPQESPTLQESVAASTIASKLRSADSALLSDELFTEEPSKPQRISQSKTPKELGGLWLVFTVLAIVVTAFGAGFLIMRPFLQTNR
jgi:hypothetical protein